jgi:hypothetical protein
MTRPINSALRVSLSAAAFALAVAACGGGSGGSGPEPAPGEDPSDPGCAESFESTFAAIQTVVFERQGCTQDVCHGSARSGGLDLRPDAAYANLVAADSLGSDLPRIQPGEPGESFLYLKLLAATEPGSVTITGSPMPNGLPPLSADHLEAVRVWIEKGAPETGSIGDDVNGQSDSIADLLGACLPPSTPITIDPLPPPPADEGIQLKMPSFVLPAGKEREVCFASYYDFSERVPERFQDRERGVFFVNGSRLRQDPQSHHLVVDHSGIGAEFVNHPSFGEWTCVGGERDGQACDPLDQESCGSAVCGSGVRDTITCAGFGPPESSPLTGVGGIAAAQTAQQLVPPRDGIYTVYPIRGLIYWNSHAFNLTSEEHQMHAYLNLTYTDDLRLERISLPITNHIYIQANQAPFTTQRYCADWVAPKGAHLLSLGSHTHKRGRDFTVSLLDGTEIYRSFVYSDPVDQDYEPPLVFDSADPGERTLRYCATFNNGVHDDGSPDVGLVTRLSTMPDRTSCRPVACAAGRIGEPCAGADDDAACDSAPGAGDGSCDACAITPGVTTENEMFVLSPAYVLP